MPKIKKPAPRIGQPGAPKPKKTVPTNKKKATRPKKTTIGNEYRDLLDPTGPSGSLNPYEAMGLKPPAGPGKTSDSNTGPLSETGQFLYNFIRSRPTAVFDTITVGEIKSSTGTTHTFSPEDRIEVLKTLLSGKPSEAINATNKGGETLLHAALRNGFLASSDKCELLRGLANLGVNLDGENSRGETALDVSVALSPLDPPLVTTLQGLGARFSPPWRFSVFAALTGLGGTVPNPADPGKNLRLEGLSPEHAIFSLDPVFREALTDLQTSTPPPMKGPVKQALESWQNIDGHKSVLRTLRTLKTTPDHNLPYPKFLPTGWSKPNRHAVSFVLNTEADGAFLYACNTGASKDENRSIVKYKLTDVNKAISFFETSTKDRSHTRSFFTEGPANQGFTRCDEDEQIPNSIDKASQKRGNCPVASRKAGLLAMMWSCSRAQGVSPEGVKAEYKKVTTGLRREGVSQIQKEGNPDLLGKALVSMLTKFDRPHCQRLAYELANSILGSQQPKTADTLRTALKKSGQKLRSYKGAGDRSLIAQAKHRNHPEALAILRELTPKLKKKT